MLILLLLILLAPAVLSVFLYERFRGETMSLESRLALFVIFAFLINAAVYVAIFLRGWDTIIWSLDSSSTLASVPFCLKYMALSLIFAIAIPYAVSLVKVIKRK